MKSGRTWLFFVVAALVPLALARADDPFSVSKTVIVVTDGAEAFAGNESIASIPSGAILTYTREEGPWLMVPRYGGWVPREHVVPLENAPPYFDKLIAEKPSPQAYHHRGIARLARGELDGALADFDQAIALGIADPGVYTNRGVARQRRGELQLAIEDYTRAIELNPHSARAFDNRGSAYAELGQLDASLADSHEALRIYPAYAEAYNNRGVTWRLKGDFARAVADYTRAIEFYGSYAAAYANRGYARKQLGELEPALADYQAAILLAPQDPAPHNDLAWLLATGDESIRDAGRAVELAERACELTNRTNGDFLDTLAAAYAAAGRFDEAVTTAQSALPLAGDESRPDIQQRLALYREQRPFVEPAAP